MRPTLFIHIVHHNSYLSKYFYLSLIFNSFSKLLILLACHMCWHIFCSFVYHSKIVFFNLHPSLKGPITHIKRGRGCITPLSNHLKSWQANYFKQKKLHKKVKLKHMKITNILKKKSIVVNVYFIHPSEVEGSTYICNCFKIINALHDDMWHIIKHNIIV
jgi:hypothetical protein